MVEEINSKVDKVLLRASPTGKISKYETPEVISYIVDKRNEGETFKTITNGLKQRGFEEITTSTVSGIHKKATARSIIYHNSAKEAFEDYTGELKNTYSEAIKLLGEYVSKLREVKKELDNSAEEMEDGVETVKAKLRILQTIPLATSLMKEIREYMKFEMDLQDKIITEQKKEVWNESQMVDYVMKYMPKLLKQYEKDGKINIIDKTILR